MEGSSMKFDFSYSPAIDYEKGVTRRDPSPVIKVGNLYYVWYSKSTNDASGYAASIWYSTSLDGYTWTEIGEAISKGNLGSWDENAVFTPTTLVADGKYYLFYTAVPKPFDNDNGGSNGTQTAIGLAVADSPDGPFIKCKGNPILKPSDTGFDSHRIDDSCIIVRNNKYYLYYKGREKGLSPAFTKMGVAISDSPTGPYTKYENNSIINSGHEVCVYPYNDGILALIAPNGPEGNSIQYSDDGLNFHIIQKNIVSPQAPGPYREDAYINNNGTDISWGICHNLTKDWPYLMRYDCKKI